MAPVLNIEVIPPEQLLELSEGNRFEISVLGNAWKFKLPPTYAPWEEAFPEVITRDLPGYDPAHPSGGLTEEFFEGVRVYMPKRRRKFLRLYVAIASRLDYYHGIDAFFYLEGVAVTLDVTTNPTKEKKADFLVTPADVICDPDGTPRGFRKAFLKKIAQLLAERHREHHHSGRKP